MQNDPEIKIDPGFILAASFLFIHDLGSEPG